MEELQHSDDTKERGNQAKSRLKDEETSVQQGKNKPDKHKSISQVQTCGENLHDVWRFR